LIQASETKKNKVKTKGKIKISSAGEIMKEGMADKLRKV
jgi:hypothetical protein